MTTITEAELVRIVDGILEDRDSIIQHNPIGPDEEILLWMLVAVLSSYLNLTEQEAPCFTGKPNAETYREAVRFILRERVTEAFDVEEHLSRLC